MQLHQDKINKKIIIPEYFDYLGYQTCHLEIRSEKIGEKVHLRKYLIPILPPCPYVHVLKGFAMSLSEDERLF